MKLVDRLLFTTTATSASTVTVAGPVAGFRTPAQAIADGDLAIDETIPLAIQMGSAWELSEFTVTSATLLTRVQVLGSSAGGATAVFAAGSKQARCTAPAEYLNGVELSSLAVITPTDAHALAIVNRTSGAVNLALISALRTLFGGTAPATDSVDPAAPTNLQSSSVTQIGFSVTFTAGTDNVSIARHEWSLDGSSWTQITSGTTFSVTGRTAGTTYTVRVRSVDTSGNVSSATTLPVTTAAASGDTTAPSMSGSIAISAITSSGYTFSYGAGSDNVAVDHYDTSIDGGANWASNQLNLSRVVTGRPAATSDNLRVRAVDAAGLMSNVLIGTATTTAAASTTASLYKIRTTNPSGGGAFQATGIPNEPGPYKASALSGGFCKASVNPRILKISDGTAPPANEVLTATWHTSATVPPNLATQNQNGQVQTLRRLAWDDTSATNSTYYALYDHAGTIYIWGPPGNYYLWIQFSDGSWLVYDNGTGTPIATVVGAP